MDQFYKKYDGSMDPYGSWQLEAYGMGPSTNPKADQLKEFNLDANWGARNIEIGFLSNKELESFPKPAAQELKRLAKLAGVKPSVHGPLEDPAGFDEYKNEQKEYARRGVVNRFLTAIDTAWKTGGENTPVVFHASNKLPGEIYSKNGKEPELEAMGVMDRESGKFVALVEKESKFDRSGEEIPFTPQDQIEMMNRTFWSENIRKLAEDRKQIEEINHMNNLRGLTLGEARERGRWSGAAIKTLTSHIDANILNIYHDFAKYMPKPEEVENPDYKHLIKTIYSQRDKLVKEHNDIQKQRVREFHKLIESDKKGDNIEAAMSYNRLMNLSLKDIDNWHSLFSLVTEKGLTPKRYISVEEFTKKPAAKTFAETAFKAYKEYGDKAPRIMIENAPAPFAFSTPEKHKQLVEEARNQLVEISKKAGKPVTYKQASELIQATMDVGHFGLWKQYGFSNEDIVKMAKKIAPITGHLHISDNFGSADAHLPPGWGNLPHKEIAKMLKEQGFKGRTIVEAGGAEALGYSPYVPSLEYFNSGIYSWAARPSWTEVGDYFFGSSSYAVPGIPLPYQHQQNYGSGFSNLPPLSDSDKKDRSGMSGTPYS